MSIPFYQLTTLPVVCIAIACQVSVTFIKFNMSLHVFFREKRARCFAVFGSLVHVLTILNLLQSLLHGFLSYVTELEGSLVTSNAMI